jgi:hypothetical protein
MLTHYLINEKKNTEEKKIYIVRKKSQWTAAIRNETDLHCGTDT